MITLGEAARVIKNMRPCSDAVRFLATRVERQLSIEAAWKEAPWPYKKWLYERLTTCCGCDLCIIDQSDPGIFEVVISELESTA